MKKVVIFSILFLAVGFVAGYFVGSCQKGDAQQVDAEEIATDVKAKVDAKLDSMDGMDSVEVHSVRVVTTTPENLSKRWTRRLAKPFPKPRNYKQPRSKVFLFLM